MRAGAAPSANPDKVAEIADILGDAVELLPRPLDVPDVVEDAAHARGQRPLEGGGAGRGDRAAGGRRRHRPRGRRARRRARRALGPLRRRASRLRRQRRQAARRAGRAWRGRPARPASAPSPWSPGPTAARWWPRACARAPSPPRCAGRGASATTRSSCPTEGDGRTFAEMTAAEKHVLRHRGRAFRRWPSCCVRPAAARRLSPRHQPRRSIGQTSSTSSPPTR